MADGSVIFDTKLDSTGIIRDLSRLASGSLKAAAAGLAALGTYAVSVGSDFESAISSVAATMGKTTDQIADITTKAKELGATTAFSATQAAEGFNILAQSGLTVEEQLTSIDSVLSLAAAGEMQMSDAAGYLTTTVKAFSASAREANISMEDTSRLADLYAKGATMANTSTAQFGDAMTGAASMAGSFNQSIDTTGTLLLALAEKGYQGSVAGTYLGRAMADLYSPTANAQKALDALGVSAYDASGNQRDMIDVVGDLQQAFVGMTEEEKASYTASIFTTAGLKAFNSIAGSSQEELEALKASLNDCTGAAERMAQVKLDSLQGDITILKSATEGFGIAIYDNMQKPLRSFVQEATKIMDDLHKAVEEGGLSGLASAVGGALSHAINMVAQHVPDLAKAAADLVGSFVSGVADAAPQVIENTSLLLSELVNSVTSSAGAFVDAATGIVDALVSSLPQIIGAIVTALPGLIDAIVVGITTLVPKIVTCGENLFSALIEGLPQIIQAILPKLPEIITGIVGGLLEMLPLIVDCGIELLVALVQGLPDIIYEIITVLPGIIDAIVQTLVGLAGEIVTCGIRLLTSLVSALPKIITTIVAVIPSIVVSIVAALIDCIPQLIQCGIDLLTSLITALPEIISAILMAVPTIISSVIDALVSNIGLIVECGIRLFTSLITALPNIIKTIVSAAPQIVTSIGNAIVSLRGQLVSAGANLLLGLADGIGSAIGNVVARARAAAQSVVSSVKSFFGIASPSKLFKNEIGKNLMLGLAGGIDDAKSAAIYAAEGAAKDIAQVDFDPKPEFDYGGDDVDYGVLIARATGVVQATRTATGKAIGGDGAYTNGAGGAGSAGDGGAGESKPKYVECSFSIDGKEFARQTAPYMEKELEWRDK